MKQIIYFSFIIFATISFAKKPENTGLSLDSLREVQESKPLNIQYNSKFVKNGLEHQLRDSIALQIIDTTKQYLRYIGNAYLPQKPMITLGGYGLAQRDLLFNPNQKIGFQLGRDVWNSYMLHHQDIAYYQARVSFSEITYSSSGGYEEIFKALITQNVNKLWNWGINFNRMASDGFFVHQNAGIMNLAFFTWYHSPKNAYQVLANICFNTHNVQENGGLVYSNVFTEHLPYSIRLVEAKLLKAVHKNSSDAFYVKQFLRLEGQDTSKKNSKRLQQVIHSSLYKKQQYIFNNTDNNTDSTTFFKNIYISTTTTNDITSLEQWENSFLYDFFIKGAKLKNTLGISLGVQHDYYSLMQNLYAKNYQNFSLKSTLKYKFNNSIFLDAQFTQISIGDNAGDYLYTIETKFQRKKGQLTIGGNFINQSPLFLYKYQNSNNSIWQNNNLNKSNLNILTIKYDNSKFNFQLGINHFLISNYVYLKDNQSGLIMPHQLNYLINLSQTFVQKEFILYKFHWNNFICFQMSNALDELATPKWYSWHSFYYQNTFFKIMKTQIGIDVNYRSKYYNASYMPNIGQFYTTQTLQQTTMPIWDIWMNLIIKKANIFIKYEFFNQGFNTSGYYFTNTYPMPESFLRYGIVWRFFE